MAIDRIAPEVRRSLALALGFVALVALAFAVLTPVPDNRAALVLRFGQPVRVINSPDGGAGTAGLMWRWPLAEQVVLLDRRLLTVTADSMPVTTRDGQQLAVDGYATWRVTDPVRFYQALGTPEQAAGPLRAILASVVRQELARTNLAGMERGPDLRAAFAHELTGYGATVTDLRLSRVALPDGAPSEAAFARMTAGAEAEAAAVAAEGHRNAQLIRADAQARAARIDADSFGKDPQFHDFYRAMQSYDATFAQKGSKTTIVLSPDNAYLQQFRGH